jgi:Xaa-Pro aminopeptidase
LTPDSRAAFSVTDTIQRLQDSLATLEWAVYAVPRDWTHQPPEPDAWSVAMNLAHLVVYEEEISAPILAALAEGSDGVGSVKSAMEVWFLKDAQAIADRPVAELVERLRAVRKREAETVGAFNEAAFNRPATPLFGGPQSLRAPGWVATKTFQHTWEHGNAILRMALFAPR